MGLQAALFYMGGDYSSRLKSKPINIDSLHYLAPSKDIRLHKLATLSVVCGEESGGV